MYEQTLNALIRKRCRELGLHAFGMTTHKIPGGSISGPGPKGYPDWTIAGPGGVIFREAKALSRRSREQMDWGKTLVEAGANYAIWRPEDWESGRIEAELVAIAGGIAGRSSAGQARPVSQARGLATA